MSGALHGNERVGPLTVMAALRLMVKAADCVAKDCHDSGANTQEYICINVIYM